jgi:hypothetical protein
MVNSIRFLIVYSFLFVGSYCFTQKCPDSCHVSIPKVLTPNCDGVDCMLLKVESICSIIPYELILFNRWGEIIFKSDDPHEAFDGSEANDGVYVWKIKGEFCDGERINEMGHVSIFR